jgi:hypothetical protein
MGCLVGKKNNLLLFTDNAQTIHLPKDVAYAYF